MDKVFIENSLLKGTINFKEETDLQKKTREENPFK